MFEYLEIFHNRQRRHSVVLAGPTGDGSSLDRNDALDALVQVLQASGLSWREVALRAGLRPNTVSGLADPDRRSTVSLRTLLALGDVVGWHIQCRDTA